MFEDDDMVFSAVSAGAVGYLLKGAAGADIVTAVRAAGAGQAVFGAALAQRLRTWFTRGPQPQAGDYVVLWQKNSKTCGFCSSALKPWTAKHPDGPPSSWKVEYTTSHGILTLYKVQ